MYWRAVQVDGKPGVDVMCAKGHLAVLDHEIASDGTVTPAMACPEDGCDFHEFVKLEGWVA